MKNTEPLAEILAKYLDAIERGEISPAEGLDQYPLEQQEELGELLETISLLEGATALSPRPEFRHVARARLLNRLEKPAPSVSLWDQLGSLWSRMPRIGLAFARMPSLVRAVSMMLIIAIVAGLGTGGVAYASTDALPGDGLYPVKTTVEDVRLAVSDTEGEVRLHIRFTERRLDEMKSLTQLKRFADISIAIQGFERHMLGAEQALKEVAVASMVRANEMAGLLDQVLFKSEQSMIALATDLPETVQADIQSAVSLAIEQRASLAVSYPDMEPTETMPTAIPTQDTPLEPDTLATDTRTPSAPAGENTEDSPTPTPVDQLPTDTPTGTPTPTPDPTDTRTPTDTPTSTVTPTASNTPSSTPTSTPLPPPTDTPVPPTSTPVPSTNTPAPIPTTKVPPGLTMTAEPPGLTMTRKPSKTPKP